MTSYAFWNNKGGVGKTFLCFAASCEYAYRHPDVDVYVLDLCPQANLSEIMLGGQFKGAERLAEVIAKPSRPTIAGYIEARLSSPFSRLRRVEGFVHVPSKTNRSIPKNISLICGDSLLELLAEAVRQTSQLVLPHDAWAQVMRWIADLVSQLRLRSKPRDSTFFIDCNPSFSPYTQQALLAADRLIVPFTPDESSRRGLENVVALLYGVEVGTARVGSHAALSFAARTQSFALRAPLLAYFVHNRVTIYEGRPSRAFAAAQAAIEQTIQSVKDKNPSLFLAPHAPLSDLFVGIPDNHSASIVCTLRGTPLHALKPGPHKIFGERIQVNPGPLDRYKRALSNFVSQL